MKYAIASICFFALPALLAACSDSPSGSPGTDAGSAAVQDAGADAGVAADAETFPDANPLGPYSEDGIETYTQSTADLNSGTHTFSVDIYLPATAAPRPVVFFAPGTQQPAASYDEYFVRLASHGFIVLARDDPGPRTPTPELVDDLDYVVSTWLPEQNADAASTFYGRIDLARIGVAGHSRGGKATLLAAEGALKGAVVAYFGVDTIDATFIDDGVYAITDVANVGIPTVFLVAEIPGTCSPANSNGEGMYTRAPSPSVFLSGLGAGHADFAMPCVGCEICTPPGTADPAVVYNYSLRYLTAFFARELLGDTSVGPAFEGAGAALDIAEGRIALRSK